MIVTLARKLLIALWRFVTTGETLEGVVLVECPSRTLKIGTTMAPVSRIGRPQNRGTVAQTLPATSGAQG